MVEGLAATAGPLGLQAASLEARDPQVVGGTAGRLQELGRQPDGRQHGLHAYVPTDAGHL
ncbi:hypothetical protein EIQ23_05675 [Xanthomonas campestris pv. campestris]